MCLSSPSVGEIEHFVWLQHPLPFNVPSSKFCCDNLSTQLKCYESAPSGICGSFNWGFILDVWTLLWLASPTCSKHPGLRPMLHSIPAGSWIELSDHLWSQPPLLLPVASRTHPAHELEHKPSWQPCSAAQMPCSPCRVPSSRRRECPTALWLLQAHICVFVFNDSSFVRPRKPKRTCCFPRCFAFCCAAEPSLFFLPVSLQTGGLYMFSFRSGLWLSIEMNPVPSCMAFYLVL